MDDKKKLENAKREFNKLFGFIKDLDIGSEYIAIRCKQSKLSSNKRKLFMSYVSIRYNNDEEFKKNIDKLDEIIKDSINKVKASGGITNESTDNG